MHRPEYLALVAGMRSPDPAHCAVIADWCLDHNLDRLAAAWREMAAAGNWPESGGHAFWWWPHHMAFAEVPRGSRAPKPLPLDDKPGKWFSLHQSLRDALVSLADALAENPP